MLMGQKVSEFHELAACVLRRIGTPGSMMQVDLNFPPTRMAMLRQPFDVSPVILLGRVKISVLEGMAIAVTPLINKLGVFPAPSLQPPFLSLVRSSRVSVAWDYRRLKMVSQRNDEMDLTGRRTPGEPLPGIARQPARSVRYFLAQSHLARLELVSLGTTVRTRRLPASNPDG